MAKSPTAVTPGSKSRKSSFPQECRRSLRSSFDRRFTLIFGVLLVIFCALFGTLSFRTVSDTSSEVSIERVQARFARLVLEKPLPKAVEPEKPLAESSVPVKESTAAPAAQAPKEEEPIDRAEESFENRQVRKEATRVSREERRSEITRQVQSAGIFAAITARGTGGRSAGGASLAMDVLGAGSGLADDLSAVSMAPAGSVLAGPSTSAAGEYETQRTRHVSRTEDIAVAPGVSQVQTTQLATSGEVSITSEPPEITGETALSGERSYDAINSSVNRFKGRLKRVYESWLKKDPRLSGKLVLKFTIMPDGTVVNGTVVSSTTGSQDFDRKVLWYVSAWVFVASPESGPIEVVYPFVFEGSG